VCINIRRFAIGHPRKKKNQFFDKTIAFLRLFLISSKQKYFEKKHM